MVKYIFLLIAILCLVIACRGIADPGISLSLPIDCQLGQSCFILQYPDRDPGPGAVDFGCGRMTNDNHKGTDFAIPDEVTMQQGIKVLAVSEGTVLRTRDGILDKRVTQKADLDAVEGIDCGNGVVIDHGQGWQSQYCHLRRGSVQVKQGDRVEPGAVLGLVGQSGAASFPHVHLSIRHQGEIVDPSVGLTATPGCNVELHPLWVDEIPYTPTGLIRIGIASQEPTIDQLWQGQYRESRLSTASEALLFWVHVYGVLQGDEETITIRTPQGEVWAQNTQFLKEPNRVWMSFVGKKTDPTVLTPGVWTGTYELKRKGQPLIAEQKPFEVVLPKSIS